MTSNKQPLLLWYCEDQLFEVSSWLTVLLTTEKGKLVEGDTYSHAKI